ncbi:MAG: hypothetical protein CTY13_05930 [Methylobacter sp.]|nr:MAG: hypothetical protein CTY13_05930 [Methylobacter sp.]
MAAEQKPESNALTTAVPVTLVLAILAGLFFTHSLPYQDERPSSRPLQSRYSAAQDMNARLWQDPFAAVDSANEDAPAQKVSITLNQQDKSLRLEAIKQPPSSTQHTRKQIYKDNSIVDGNNITILAVTLPGGPYQEAAEQRMRRRYAVLSALANQDQFPEDEQHIGYFQPESTISLPARVPFEWWTQKSDDNNKLLVLWVDESNLLRHPAAKIKELLCQASLANSPQGIVFNYAVIGPNTSTLLRDMLKEVNSDAAAVPCSSVKHDVNTSLGEISGRDIVYFSAAATASDHRLLEGIVPEPKNQTVSAYLFGRGIRLFRTTATDNEMMATLAYELAIRRVKNPDHVVILSEWDTFYGRAMPEAFRNAWHNDHSEKTVHVYGYMRGLDGKLPDQAGKTGNLADKNPDTKDKSSVDALIEFPEGQSQKDYLRRLSENILALDRHVKNNGHSKGVSAIGLLGSDVHDKLLILEALRQHFPHKLFFTTDMDAGYSHPAKWLQTRNLLVASAFDLKLHDKLQDKIPAFRDSYQTAFFLAAQMVLQGGTEIAKHIGRPPVRLFEIGRSHSVALPTVNNNKSNGPLCSWSHWADCKTVQPDIFPTLELNVTWQGMMVVVFVILVPLLVSWRVCRLIFSCLSNSYYLGGLGVMAILAYFLARSWNNYITRTNAEPFYWLEGVSAWPSQLLRISLILFAAGFFLWGRLKIRKMQKNLAAQIPEDLQHQEESLQQIFALPYKPDQLGHCDVLFIGSWEEPKLTNSHAVVHPAVLWKKYLGYCYQKKLAFSGAFLRITLHGLVFIGLGISLMLWSGFPASPIRGCTGLYWHKGILAAAVIATVMLTMWVVDNARLCERLIKYLSAKPSHWNEHARKWALQAHKVAPECVEEWLDIQLIVRLTKTMQPMIWGPMVCIGLLVLARSPAIDDWDIPWGLGLVFITMLLYAISAEVYLQRGAKLARTKAISLLNGKIRAQLNLDHPDEAVIKRIEPEIENIRNLRDGAFIPWYEWPLLRSFGGLGTLVFVLEYLAQVWGSGTL